MATFPTSLKYSATSYSVSPEVARTQFASGNTRQRMLRAKLDDMHSVSLRLDNAGLLALESFIDDTINGGADTYTGPFITDTAERTGTLELIDGTYQLQYVANDMWDCSFSFEVKNVDLSDHELIYDVVNEFGGFNFSDFADALEQAVNFNNL